MADKYWDERADLEYEYKGEKFYTMTAVPYYYARRAAIINKLKKIIHNGMSVCDFGCGDGVYIEKISNTCSCFFHGVDISEHMINLAKKHTKSIDATFEVSGEGIKTEYEYDVVYSSAVFAHIDDNVVGKLFCNINNHMHSGGKFVLCEQTAPYRYEGKGFKRRTLGEYRNLLTASGFKVVESTIIDFWIHRIIFERMIGKLFIAFYKKKYPFYDKQTIMIRLNGHKCYRTLSWICTKLSFPHLFKGENRWGYCFIVAEK